ncbi:MAG: ATP-binding cassette domain-containing protein [Clostridia bacterium]|nr:ATP-binding cassette domain-containing protein [Clostridia bacterium]
MSIKLTNLTKDYGSGRGIFDLDLEINEGETVGFVGTNGSGKTTTIRSILGFIKPTSGTAEVNGLESWRHSSEIVKNIGYVPGEIAFPDLSTGTAFLKSQAEFLSVKDMTRCDELIKRLQLDPRANLKRMSKGMKQKTAIVAAFMSSPDIYLLDEPTTGLDPLMRDSFLDIVREEQKKGKTVLMSSHMFEELEPLCDRVALISDGKIVDIADMKKIRKPETREYKIEFFKKTEYQNFKKEGFLIVRDQPEYNQLTVRIDSKDINTLFNKLTAYGVRLIAEVKYNLEKYFKTNLNIKGEKDNVQ